VGDLRAKSERIERIHKALQRLKDKGIEIRHATRQELKFSIVEMIEGGKKKYGKKYFRPALDTAVILLAERQHIETSLRTVSRAIRELVDEKAIWRKNRHTRGKGIRMVCRATAYYVLYKGQEMFRKMLQRAQRVLGLLGVPKLAPDNVTPKRVFSTFDVLEGLRVKFDPLKIRSRPSEAFR